MEVKFDRGLGVVQELSGGFAAFVSGRFDAVEVRHADIRGHDGGGQIDSTAVRCAS